MNNMYDILAKMKLVESRGNKPDFLDIDKDGDKKEPMKQAAKQAKEVDESIEEADYSAKKARAGKDIGKPGKQFAKIAKSAGERYGSKERGEKVAGAVLAKLRKGVSEDDMEEGSSGTARLARIATKAAAQVLNDFDRKILLRAAKLFAAGKKEAGLEVIERMDDHARDDFYMQLGLSGLKKKGMKFDEADMEEGNDFTGARLAAIRAGKPTFKVDGKTYKVTGDTSDERKQVDEREFHTRDEFDDRAEPGDTYKKGNMTITKTTGGIHVRHETDYDPGKDDNNNDNDDGAPKRRGRPKGTGRSIGAKGPTGRSKLLKKGAIKEAAPQQALVDAVVSRMQSWVDYRDYGTLYDVDESDIEPALTSDPKDPKGKKIWQHLQKMPVRDYNRFVQAVMVAIEKKADEDDWGDDDDLPESAEGTKSDDVKKAMSLLKKHGYKVSKEIEEKAVSRAQQRFMGMVHAAQKGEKPASKEVAKVAGEMPKKAAKDYAKTKHAGLPEKVKKDEGKEEMEETTAGSVATAPAAEAPKGKKGGMVFGKGVYESRLEESYSQRLKEMLTEGMSINASQDEQGGKSLTVTATDDDAVKLAQILQLAGMPQGTGYEEVCPACGSTPCGCEEQVDEDLANAPDERYADTDTMVNTLSGGLNGRKSTGQTTIPVINRDPARQGIRGVADEIREQTETRLWDLYKKYEGK